MAIARAAVKVTCMALLNTLDEGALGLLASKEFGRLFSKTLDVSKRASYNASGDTNIAFRNIDNKKPCIKVFMTMQSLSYGEIRVLMHAP
ncbi:hypothetical protein EON65_55950 [archaeon]|nr:MAG: hypothetical protein EON65_55950 [archaeon]